MIKILTIEDDAALQKAYKGMFGNPTYTLFQATDGTEGIALAIKEKPDVILLDMMMPKTNGIEVINALKASDVTKNIPIIVLSNLLGSEMEQEAKRLGVTKYLTKSDVSPDEIEQTVNEALHTN